MFRLFQFPRPDEPTLGARLVRLAIDLLYFARLRRTRYEVLWAVYSVHHDGHMDWGPAVVLVTRHRRRPRWLPTPAPDHPGWSRELAG